MSSAGIALVPTRDVQFEALRDWHRAAAPDSILIYLAVPGTPAIPMHVFESDSIASIKLRIQNAYAFKKQKLVFHGRELARSNCLIRDYGVADGNVLHLVVRLSDLRIIAVTTVCGKKFRFHVESCRNVAYVKHQIAKKDEDLVDDKNQKLFYDGEELDDWRMVDDIAKYNDAVIHLVVYRSGEVCTKSLEADFELSVIASTKEGDVFVIPRNPSFGSDVWVDPIIVNPQVELPRVIRDLIRSASAGLEKGNYPIMSSEGTGGAYFMQDELAQDYIAVFKPIDEEPMAENNPRGLPLSMNGEGLKRGTRVGEGALREVAAYILDHPLSGRRSMSSDAIGFSGVPPTCMVQCLHEAFNHPNGFERTEKYLKIGSLQMFVKNEGSCEDMGPRAFPVEEVHKICVLDMRLANTDRHGGNILFYKKGEQGNMVLVPIDHGYCLPEDFEDCTFEWLYWPQARQPFNSETIDYINSMDAEQDIALLKFYGWELSLECARTLRISTMLLKKGVERGLTPYDIGNILCRETVKKESKIEEIVREAKDNVLPDTGEAAFIETVSEIMDRRLDELAI